MTRSRFIMLCCVFSFTLVFTYTLTRSLVPEEAQAQLIDIDVDGVRRIIGDEPTPIGDTTYRVRMRWVPRSLAVYADGKRLQRKVDYVVNLRERTVTLLAPATVLVVDYEPR